MRSLREPKSRVTNAMEHQVRDLQDEGNDINEVDNQDIAIIVLLKELTSLAAGFSGHRLHPTCITQQGGHANPRSDIALLHGISERLFKPLDIPRCLPITFVLAHRC